jgi:hypothetical protein
VSTTPSAISEESVEALLGDLRYVVDNCDADEWALLATEVLKHHSPPIDDELLSERCRELQQACRTMLEAMRGTDEDAVRTAAMAVKQYL